MSIETSIKGVTAFLERNDQLIKKLMDAAGAAEDVIKGFSEEVERNRAEAEAFVAKLGTEPMEVASDVEVKRRQKRILEEIGEVGKRIRKFQDMPSITAPLLTQRAALYMELANTYNDLVAGIVPISAEERNELEVLLQRAVLDTAKRKNQAAALDAAVSLTKLALKIGVGLLT